MDRNLMISFLTKEAIKSQGDERGRLWDCIWKANRDAMTGTRTKNIPQYCAKNKDVEKSKGNEKNTLDQLYEIIINEEIALCSATLRKKLQVVDSEIEFSALQKLVNMTLKYIIILKEFEGENFKYEVCEEGCECPIDSIILEHLKKINGIKHTCWTKMGKEEYLKVQYEIRKYLKEKYPSEEYGNIWFDFLMWNPN